MNCSIFFIWLAIVCSNLATYATETEVPGTKLREESTNRQVALWFDKISCRTICAEDYKHLEQFIEKAKDPRERIDGLIVMSRFQRVSLGNSEAALQILRHVALSAEILRQLPGKKIKLRGDQLFSGDISHPENWNSDDANFPAVLEVARILATMGKNEESLVVIKMCKDRPSLTLSNQALLAYAAGDCLMEMGRIDDAIGMYGFAQGAISDLEKPYDQLTDELKIIKIGLQKSMDIAKAKVDTEKYGPEYILYRQADRLRRFDNQPVLAYVDFQKIIRAYPNTIYAEAATAYSIECLCDCASGSKGDLVGIALKNLGKRADELTNSLRDMAKLGSTNEVINTVGKLINEQKTTMEMLGAIHELNSKSEPLILKMASVFISSKPLGVYRGEVMIALGDYYFEGENKTGEALTWYVKAISWYEDIARRGVVDDVIVESRVKEISAPPLTMKSKDEWGNVSRSAIAAGGLINHRTCEWYSAQQMLDAKIKAAAIYFAEGNVESAVLFLKAIIKLDIEENRLHEMGLPNSYDRLINGMRSGRLNATETELGLFKNEAKIALIAAEVAYETENWVSAQRLYSAVTLKYGDSLSKNARLYLRFMRGSTLLMVGNEKEAEKEFQAVAEDPKSPTYPRAMWCLFNLSQFDRGRDGESISYLDKVIRTQEAYAQDFTFTKAEFLFSRNRISDARVLFKGLSNQKNCKPWMLLACKNYIEKIESYSSPNPPDGQ